MADLESVKRVILKVAGNPSSGPIRDLVDEWARQIVALDEEPAKETRIIEASEKR